MTLDELTLGQPVCELAVFGYFRGAKNGHGGT